MNSAPTLPAQGLYIHVPFCARKCEYCAFYSEPTNSALIQRYVDALCLEFQRVAPASRPATVFFGGGTPSLLTPAQWESILRTMERLELLGASEWTIECNPATVSLDKARLWRSFGVNRVSMGVQSLDESLLDRLGRIHSRQAVFHSFDLLRRAGFDNINIDLMFAIPGQTLAIWESTLDEALAMGSEHLSSYEVIYEEDTPLYEQLQAGEFDVDDALACAMHDTLIDRAGAAGFVQYEIANFARDSRPDGAPCPDDPVVPARACRHNMNYWRGGAFHGLGPSAAGFLPDRHRTKNVSNTVRYCELLERGEPPVEWRESLPPLARAGEIAAFGLRMNTGWDFEEFRSVTGFDLRDQWGADMESLVARGWGRRTPDRFRLSREGLRFADAAAEVFLK